MAETDDTSPETRAELVERRMDSQIAARTQQITRDLRRMQRKAWRDSLTGVNNRRMLDEKFPEIFAAQRDARQDLTVVMLDLDHFKKLNDTLGHAAEIGEDVFAALKEKMGITDDSIFRFPAGRDNKIHIYAYKNHYPTQWGGQAYMGGFIIYSLDHPQRTAFGHTEPEIYTSVVKHELVHVIQSLIIGRVDNRLVDVWFSEGIAEAISESTLYTRVDSQAKLDELTSTFGMLNPIAMHLYDYPDIESVESLYYYPMFRLAVDYLTDPNGHGRTYHDIRDLLLDVADGMRFGTSFKNRFGMTLYEYESQFFDLMDDYLD